MTNNSWQRWLVLLLLGATAVCQADLATPNDTDSSIIGGSRADIEDYPFQVALLDDYEEQFCGGAIIARDAVLTAQHCVSSVDGYPVYVGTGRSNWEDTVASSILVRYTINYPRYGPIVGGKDFSILILQHQLTFSTRVQAIPMATPADETAGYMGVGKVAEISGWGVSSRGRNPVYPRQLQAAQVKIVSREFATNRLRAMSYDQLPAGDFPGSGRRDSGGPLTVKKGSDKILAGLTSWGEGCADGFTPGVYARVSHFTNWANRVLGIFRTATVKTYDVQVATITMARFTNKNFNVMIPRGLKMVHFTLSYPPSKNTRATLSVRFDNPASDDPDCSTRLTCSIPVPTEGIYKLRIRTASQGISNVKLIVSYETLSSSPTNVVFNSGEVKIGANGKVYFPGFPTFADSPITAQLEGSDISSLVLAHKSGGFGHFNPLPATGGQVLTDAQGSSLGVTSFAVRNVRKTGTTFTLVVNYQTLRRVGTAQQIEFLQNQPMRGSKAWSVPKTLKAGTELGIQAHVTKGSITIIVRFGQPGWDEWRCKVGTNTFAHCSGIVPQHSGNVKILVTSQGRTTTTYRLGVTYESA